MEREKPDNPYEAIGFGDFGSYFKNKKIKLQLQQDEMYVYPCSLHMDTIDYVVFVALANYSLVIIGG